MNILKKTNIAKLQKLGLTDTADKINEMVEFLNELPQEVDSDWLPDRHINLSAGQGDGFHEPHVVNRVVFKDEHIKNALNEATEYENKVARGEQTDLDRKIDAGYASCMGKCVTQYPKDCTCASFFTVRGKHKFDCPMFEPEPTNDFKAEKQEDWEEEFKKLFGTDQYGGKFAWRQDLAIPFFCRIIKKERDKKDKEYMGFAEKTNKWLNDFKDESWADNFDKAFPCESEMCKTGCICGMAEIKDFIYETIIGERRIAYQKGKEDYYNQTRRQNKEAKLETAKINFKYGKKQLAQNLLDYIRDDMYYEKEDINKFLKLL